MKLVHYDFEESFNISPDTVNVLVVEAEDKFFEYCTELMAQTEGDDGGFCLSDNDKNLSLSKHAVIVNAFDLKINEKKLITKLYAYLHTLLDEKLYLEANELGNKWAELFTKLNAESQCPIEYDEDDFSLALLKTFNVKFAAEGQTLLEKIASFIHIWSGFLNITIFIFVNLKTMLTADELLELYKDAELCQVNLFLIENTLKPVLKGEKVLLIDRDLCEILVK